MSRERDEIIGRISNPEGVPVVLLERVWNKVVGDHPELTPLSDSVLKAVGTPDHIELDPVRPNGADTSGGAPARAAGCSWS
jgi:hypothetical protein